MYLEFSFIHLLTRTEKNGKKKQLKAIKKLFIALLWLLPFIASAQEGKTAPPPPKVYTAVEKPPYFPGGESAMYKFIGDNLKYPAGEHPSGSVFIRFVVSENDKIENAQIAKGIDKDCDAEALRVVRSMPEWTPGQDKGKAVPVSLIVRIVFKTKTPAA